MGSMQLHLPIWLEQIPFLFFVVWVAFLSFKLAAFMPRSQAQQKNAIDLANKGIELTQECIEKNVRLASAQEETNRLLSELIATLKSKQ